MGHDHCPRCGVELPRRSPTHLRILISTLEVFASAAGGIFAYFLLKSLGV